MEKIIEETKVIRPNLKIIALKRYSKVLLVVENVADCPATFSTGAPVGEAEGSWLNDPAGTPIEGASADTKGAAIGKVAATGKGPAATGSLLRI